MSWGRLVDAVKTGDHAAPMALGKEIFEWYDEHSQEAAVFLGADIRPVPRTSCHIWEVRLNFLSAAPRPVRLGYSLTQPLARNPRGAAPLRAHGTQPDLRRGGPLNCSAIGPHLRVAHQVAGNQSSRIIFAVPNVWPYVDIRPEARNVSPHGQIPGGMSEMRKGAAN
jgi:hypothetical protein